MKNKISIVASLIVSLTLISSSMASALSWNVHNLSARDGKFKFTVTSISCGAKSYSSADGYMTDTAQGVFCRVGVTIKNIGRGSQMLDDSAQTLNSRSGVQYTADGSADIDLNSSGLWELKTLNPGLSISGFLFFDVPVKTRIASLTVHDSAYSGGATLNLKSVGAHS